MDLMNPLRTHRVERGLSLSELAEAAGMGRAELAAVERGERRLTREQQIDLAQRLKIEPSVLDAYAG